MQKNLVSKADITTVVSLSDMLEHLKIDGSTFDNEVTALMESANDYIESQTGRNYPLTTFQYVYDKFQTTFELSTSLQSVTSVTYWDENNSQQTLATSAYWIVKPTSDYGYIQLKNSAPSTYNRPDAVTIEFTTSFAPKRFDHTLKVVTSLMNEEREGWKEIEGVKSLIGSLKTGKYI